MKVDMHYDAELGHHVVRVPEIMPPSRADSTGFRGYTHEARTMASQTTIPMSLEQMAKAMASRVARERARIAARIDELAAANSPGQNPYGSMLVNQLHALAEELRGPAQAGPVIVPTPPEAQPQPGEPEPMDEGELPEVRHMDDFQEGVALIQGGMHRRNIVGYPGATGGLARD